MNQQILKERWSDYAQCNYQVVSHDPERPMAVWLEPCDYVVWDPNENFVVCVVWKKAKGLSAEYLAGQGISFEASNLDDMFAKLLSIEKEYV